MCGGCEHGQPSQTQREANVRELAAGGGQVKILRLEEIIAQERRNGSWMILLRRGFARLLHYAAEIVEAEPGGSLLGNGLVLPLIDLRAPALGIVIAGREPERLIEVGFGVGEFIQAKEGPASPPLGLRVVRNNLDSAVVIGDRAPIVAHHVAGIAAI